MQKHDNEIDYLYSMLPYSNFNIFYDSSKHIVKKSKKLNMTDPFSN